jgi:hypothetical protein
MYTNCAESAEEADSQEPLEFDDKQYPQLSDNVLEMQLHRWKAILRQFMAAVRCMCYLIPFQTTCTNCEIQCSISFMAESRGMTLLSTHPTI